MGIQKLKRASKYSALSAVCFCSNYDTGPYLLPVVPEYSRHHNP